MKHIELVETKPGELVPEFLVSISSNSFGDQVLEFRSYGLQNFEITSRMGEALKCWGYRTEHVESFPEGSHIGPDTIKELGRKIFKLGDV